MANYNWLSFCCPTEWCDDPKKIDKITALMKRFKGKFEGSYKYRTFNLVYRFKVEKDETTIDWEKLQQIQSQLINLIRSWGKKIFDELCFLVEEEDNMEMLKPGVVQDYYTKPRQLWTPEEKAAEKAQKQSASKVVGQIFTYLEKPKCITHSCDFEGYIQVVIFLSEKRGWFKTITLDMCYDGNNQDIRIKSWSRSEIEQSLEKKWLIQQDLEFLIKFGSPSQVLLKAIREHIDPYQQAINILEPAVLIHSE